MDFGAKVSIVSIQTDQSRLWNCLKMLNRYGCFNRINPNRSIPTKISLRALARVSLSFNRINPNRSIPTTLFLSGTEVTVNKVSIVSIQTDQSRPLERALLFRMAEPDVSIVSIQTDQSRRARTAQPVVAGPNVSIVSIQTDQSRLWYRNNS